MGHGRRFLDPEFKELSREAFIKVIEIFNKNNIPFWLEYGTLLGCIRNKDFIDIDDDIDLGMKVKDFYKSSELIFSKVKELGFRIDGLVKIPIDNKNNDIYFGGKEVGTPFRFSIMYHGGKKFSKASIDVQLHIRGKGEYLDRRIDLTLHKIHYEKDLFPLIESRFLNQKVFVPLNCQQHLFNLYGESWRIPI